MCIVPSHMDQRSFPPEIVEADAVILVKGERTVRAGIDAQAQRCSHDLICILPHGIEGKDGACAHIKRHDREVYLSADPPSARQAGSVPPVVPGSLRQVNIAMSGSFFKYGSYQEVASPKVFATQAASDGILR